MAVLQLEDLAKRYNRKVWGVRKMDLEVKDKEFIVFLGPSGCGKTTCMRMIAGLEETTRGTIILDGQDITDLAPRDRHISMVFQNYAIWPHMSVFDNIAFSLKLKGLSKDVVKKTVVEVAEMVKIEQLLDRFPGQMSGGQQQRVALARALAVKPKLFLMDEPLSNLDAKLRVVMRTELKAIHQKTGATSVFVTHDQSEAMSMADRIVIMRDGEIIQVGTPEDVYFRSADTFVAGFIGTPPTNFFSVKLKNDGNKKILEHPDFICPLQDDEFAAVSKDGREELILGIRPEDFQLTTTGKGILNAEVLVVEPQGSHQVLAVEIDNKIVKTIISSDKKLSPGDPVSFNLDYRHLHFFDKDSEQRIS
ncbi:MULTISPECIES: ABC transporter ATP-binding protein [unclassified Oceanispirochaeta]|uniref:ABC transporter ATP-binding protein n=1 Tax=unclassified Oceanispirochaeta TaxID=2635722 RepID=UPI000E09B653|nr:MULTISPECIES: ABC transporter ATP-binding protein [unclassified Oceanispirochaeta]MBF9016932.1 ABC transporter ATP-binding protein [Oceanispirochaeta sp. M2]NPD73295.1 ABC transporter ATP-binding protein [Oceanispirochaeta sp. M1]RDG30959.1 ABC transporter ATP-binding protein [Oceanispirochaeta sp. M1]